MTHSWNEVAEEGLETIDAQREGSGAKNIARRGEFVLNSTLSVSRTTIGTLLYLEKGI